MKRIILDTNFLLIPFKFKVDIFAELQRIMDEPYELFVLDKTIDELKSLIKSGNNEAEMALKLILQKKVNILDTKSLNMHINSKKPIADDVLAEIDDENTIIATQDKPLKKRLKKVIILRNKKRLEYVL